MTKELYNQLYFHRSRKFQTNPHRIQELYEKIVSYKPKNVLDIGCGRGFLVKELNNGGIYCMGFDFSNYAVQTRVYPNVFLRNAKDLSMRNKMFDIVVSTDFFEHIPDEEIDQVYSEMCRVGKKVLARIAVSPESIKENKYHVSVHDKKWWQKRCKGIILI